VNGCAVGNNAQALRRAFQLEAMEFPDDVIYFLTGFPASLWRMLTSRPPAPKSRDLSTSKEQVPQGLSHGPQAIDTHLVEWNRKTDHTAVIFHTKRAYHNPLVGGSNPPAATVFAIV
jgi:hypothetical protein